MKKYVALLAVCILAIAVAPLMLPLHAQQNSVGTAGGPQYSTQYNSNTGLNGAGPGTVGQVFTSNGPSAPPSFQNGSGSVIYETASGALAVGNSVVSLGSTGALAMTLAAPATPAQDAIHIFIVAATAHAHTVTTPASGIIGSKHIVTFAAQGDAVELEAIGGVWYVRALYGGATLS